MVIPVPENAKNFVSRTFNVDAQKGNICILAGSSAIPALNISVKGWIKIIEGLGSEFPSHHIYLTGKFPDETGNRTATNAYFPESIQQICDGQRHVSNAFDIGLWNQLALIEACDLLISVHSGFGFLASCVGTPWLIISGIWPEYFFNQTPFYSLFPQCKEYPCYAGKSRKCIDRERVGDQVECMREETIADRLGEILQSARLLLSKGFTYKQALRLHLEHIHESGRDVETFAWGIFKNPESLF